MKTNLLQICSRQNRLLPLALGLGVGWAVTKAINPEVGIAIGAAFALFFLHRQRAD